MIWSILGACAFAAISYGGGYGVGYVRGNRSRLSRHEHLWDEWKDSHITYSDGEQISAQRRWCITCNEKQVRKVFEE